MTELSYPISGSPEPGQTIEVVPGVKWLRMPLFMKLDHINLYLVKDHDGWFIVDTGLRGESTREHWETIFANELEGLPVKGVIVTHLHPDHVGQAGWLTQKWQTDLWMTRTEYLATRLYLSTTGHSDAYIRFFERAGLNDQALEQLRKGTSGISKMVEPLPGSFRRLEHDQVMSIGGREWRIIVGFGHSPEHACLYCESLNLLISGDQVLPKITPNVSVNSTEPEADALKVFLETLERLKGLPEDTLTLPAHNEPFLGLHTRLQDMINHHEESLDRLTVLCENPVPALELIEPLFKRPLKGAEMMMGMGECIAHLNYLINQGRMKRTLESGVYYYQSVAD
ncbi:MBL fold metallo-hydrolase [Endozoicomonas arenosclerae]|uniref:MBL fold metallo-hydrolase n=1 Tax=Endozoicomonas arenosclerae TaxID=1633495 RepID=UPI000AC56423|nr:MBL fold metallo-hydrolase [Endozoicomonas arenosclerae]